MRTALRGGVAPLIVVALAALSCAQPAANFDGLPWIENDYATALEVAREKDLPIFVESWAPW